jgi:hypothetical protein
MAKVYETYENGGFLYRLGQAGYWLFTAIAALVAVFAVWMLIYSTEPVAAFMLGIPALIISLIIWGAGKLVRYIFSGY